MTENSRHRIGRWWVAGSLAAFVIFKHAPWANVVGILGAGASAVSSHTALYRMESASETSSASPMRLRPLRFALVAIWGVLLLRGVELSLGSEESIRWGIQSLTMMAVGVSAIAWFGALAEIVHHRRHELGVPERVGASVAVTGLMGALAVGFVTLAHETPDRAAIVTTGLAGLLLSAVANHRDAVGLAYTVRVFVMLVVVGGAIGWWGARATAAHAHHASAILVFTAVSLTTLGYRADVLVRRWRPARGLWLDAVDRALEDLLRSAPEDTVRSVLSRLREPLEHGDPSPELWMVDPPHVFSVDAAGYLQERDASPPAELVSLAVVEPYATLRHEVMRAIAFRRADLRRTAHWLDDRQGLAATLVVCEGEVMGVLVIPSGGRSTYVSLEEVRAFKALADRLATVLSMKSSIAQSNARAEVAAASSRELAMSEDTLRGQLDQAQKRETFATLGLAQPAMVGGYAATSRLALEGIQQRIDVGVPFALVAPSGVDPIPVLARKHSEGPRNGLPFFVIDGTSIGHMPRGQWDDPDRSPFALGRRGMLVLRDGAALPLEIQRVIDRRLALTAPDDAERTCEALVVLTSTRPLEQAVHEGRLLPSLLERFMAGPYPILELPRLADRAEDLRALITDRLGREGLRVRGMPVGIEPAAFAQILESGLIEEEAELEIVVRRLVGRTRGDLIRRSDVEGLMKDPVQILT